MTNSPNLYAIELSIPFTGSWNKAISLFDIFLHNVPTFNLSKFEITFSEFIANFSL